VKSITVREVPWDAGEAVALREAMLAELFERYRDRVASGQLKWSENVEIDSSIAHTAIATDADGRPVGHIALRWSGPDLEIKRMYVTPPARGTGVAEALLAAVERTAASMGATRLILQTGDRQPEAVRRYERSGYARIPVFPPYESIEFSLCFAKPLATSPLQPAPRRHDTGVETGKV
jgi:GNAT superfamily N-acetyltransferase